MKDQYKTKITDPNLFFGRRALVSKIYARIGAGRPQSVSIVGDVRIGKSSLLWFLAHDKTKEKILLNPADYIFVFVPCRNIQPLSLEGFTELLYQLTRKHANIEDDAANTGFRYNYFKQLVESLHKKSKKIILFLDDFNLVTQNPAFPLEFFSFLRSLANNYNLAYVTTSYEDLQKLCVSKDIEESPFFNIFTNMSLRGFEPEEVTQFLELSFHEGNGSLLTETDYLKNLVGNAPYPLGIASQHLLNFKNEPGVWDQERRFLFESHLMGVLTDYYQRLWSGLEEIHRSILLNLARNHRVPDSQEYIIRDLSKKDYIKIGNGRKEFTSAMLRKYILQTSGSEVYSGDAENRISGLLVRLKKIFSKFLYSQGNL
jgi:serine/threonine-protein kinase